MVFSRRKNFKIVFESQESYDQAVIYRFPQISPKKISKKKIWILTSFKFPKGKYFFCSKKYVHFGSVHFDHRPRRRRKIVAK